MGFSLKSVASTAFAIVLGIGLGTAFAWQTASAVTVEDNTGNPDAAAPVADPDDAGAAQGGGYSIFGSDQGSGGGWSITLGSPDGSGDTTQPPSQ